MSLNPLAEERQQLIAAYLHDTCLEHPCHLEPCPHEAEARDDAWRIAGGLVEHLADHGLRLTGIKP